MKIKTNTGLCAVVVTLIGFLCILIAFCTPYWLVNDGKISNPQFLRIGLWEVCFQKFEDIRHFYDYRFTGCWWVFEEEYYIIDDFLLPGFFIATQFFFTLCMTLLLIAAFLTWMYIFCSRHHDKYLILLYSIGTDLIIAGICGTIAVIIFGANGDRRDWMPNWEHNDLSWSFALAVVGSLLLLPAGSLFLVEGRRARFRKLRNEDEGSQYGMDVRKPAAHTDI
ncbi:uncharacterized protein LOC108733733 [Agrilus planipennis]|uniref:Uncharacterized protein LOC108733733 n=1 Tax=Agrilus planipennis TaxID=224129 RepID=A0A1W4W956_AGRPL|nr:uncharacterized protein LOC108733733 [Agrilus planipennis]